MNRQQKYRQLKQLHDELPLFYQPWWLDVACQQWDVVIAKRKEGIEAVFPFQIEQKAGMRLMRNAPLCPYLGPYFFFEEPLPQKQWKREDNTLSELLSQMPEVHYQKLITTPGWQNFLPFHHAGFSNSIRLTYFLDLSATEEILFGGIQSRLRTTIRKADKSLYIKQESRPDLKTFLAWHKKAFQNKKDYYPYSLSLIKEIIKVAEAKGASLFQTAYNQNDEPIAMLWTPFDRKKAYHLLAAKKPDAKIKGAPALLTWNAIKILKGKGLPIYDFEGSMDKGIESFFRKFGGKRVPYLVFEKYNSKLWKWKKQVLG